MSKALMTGWFRTGDLGLLDEEGFLHFRGRLKEMIKTGGINVSPAEVEAVLIEVPEVELAYVIGLPDPERDQQVAAVIVPRDGAAPTAEALTAHCAEHLAALQGAARVSLRRRRRPAAHHHRQAAEGPPRGILRSG